MDWGDEAEAIEQAIKDKAIKAIQGRGRELEPSGECHWCGDLLSDGVRVFCDKDCANDYERSKRVA